MAGGGKVKKGFASYLVILFFMILTAFFVIFTIMLFTPFKPILGLKYFYYNSVEYKYNETSNLDSKDTLDFTNARQITFNSNYANIEILRDAKVDKPAIKVTNKLSGFAKENQNTDFTYSINYDSEFEHLTVKVNEPQGFVFLNKDLTISLLVPSEYTKSFASTTINIINTSGRITLGNNAQLSSGETSIDFYALNIKTNSGRTIVNSKVGNRIDNFFFKSESGSLEAEGNLQVNKEFKIYSKSGTIKFNKVSVPSYKDIELELIDAKFSANEINGDVNLNLKNGYFDVEKINGSLLSNDSINQMSFATINIKNINGDVSFPYANKSRINLGEFSEGKQVYICGTSSNIKIDKLQGAGWIETTSGNVTLTTYSNDISVKTTTGKINVSYNNQSILNQLDLQSQKGEINLNVRGDLKFILEIYNTNDELRDSKNINIELYDKEFKNPLYISGGDKIIKIKSNGRVNLSLIGI